MKQLNVTRRALSQMAGMGKAGDSQRILERLEELQNDPLPNGKNKKRLKGNQEFYSFRFGNVRAIYRILGDCVRIDEIGPRRDIYRNLNRLDSDEENVVTTEDVDSPDDSYLDEDPYEELWPTLQSDPELPTPIDQALLQRLNIERSLWPALLDCRTLEDLCRASIPEDVRDWVFDCVCDASPQWLNEERSYVVEDTEDLRRVLDGEFVNFLLKLDDRQNQVVEEFTARGGPALVTGGPGSGKSVVAIYAARAIVRSQRAQGRRSPKLLVTTFTNALENTIRQELEAILEDDISYVQISTLDSLAKAIASSGENAENSGFRRNSEQDMPAIRRSALEAVRSGAWTQRFDGVIVDEAQDLDDNSLELALSLSRDFKDVLVTADTDQSIYEGRVDVNSSLLADFKKWHLATGHRTTKQILDAARDYIGDAAPERKSVASVKSGHKPMHRIVKNPEDEAALIATYFGWATVQARTGYGTCAVLTRSNDAANFVARRLRAEGVPATYMQGNQFDLSAPGVKVLTLHSAKGLEFSCVAIAGFFESRPYTGPDAQIIHRNRRTMYVGMTRAVRSLLLVQPENDHRYEFSGISETYWNSRVYQRFPAERESTEFAAGY